MKKGQKGFLGRDILLKVRKGGKRLIRAGPQTPDQELELSPDGGREP